SKLFSGVKLGLLGELFPEFAFGIAHIAWHFDGCFNDEIALCSLALRQTAPADAQLLAGLRAGRDTNVNAAIQRRNGNVSAENGFTRSESGSVSEVVIFDFEIGMLGEANAQEKVASLAASRAGFASSGDAQTLTFSNSGRNLDLVSIGFCNLAGAATD